MLSQDQWVPDGYCVDCGATRFVMGDKVTWDRGADPECLHRLRNEHEQKARTCTVCNEYAGDYTEADWYEMQETCDECWAKRGIKR